MKNSAYLFLKVLAVAAITLPGIAYSETEDLLDLSLEELSKVSVTSLSKRAEQLNHAPAAMFVLTHNDIMRSGINSIPELLRLVPGLNVARIDSHTWAITSRGFNSNYANKLLVLIDGRSVYNSIFSGVNWDQLDLLLDDIERIEVIRGPGATVWGANAVNGVINIITKNSKDTKGGYAFAGGGSEEKARAGARYGAQIDEDSTARIYAKGFVNDDTKKVGDGDRYDAWESVQTGFRYDNKVDTDNTVSLHGDLQYGSEDEEHRIPVIGPEYFTMDKKEGNYNWSNIVGDWQHKISDKSSLEVQAYLDHHRRDTLLSLEEANTSDIQVEYNLAANDRHTITAGIGYRNIHDSIDPRDEASGIMFNPRSRQSDIFNTFIQDEISLIPDELKLSLGTKLEHNDYSGIVVQPSARLSYLPTEFSTVWTSFSKAARTPSRVEDGINFVNQVFPSPEGIPTALIVEGNKHLDPENLYAYELGYRVLPEKNVSLDFTGFINHYNDLFAPIPQTPQFVPGADFSHIEVPVQFFNADSGNTYGLETVATWQPYSWWRIQGWYSYINMDIKKETNNSTPENQLMLRSSITINDKFEIDPRVRYVDTITSIKGQSPVDAYIAFDLRLGYKVRKDLNFSITGQNLLDGRHQEFSSFDNRIPPSEIQRAVYAKVAWSW